jgi:hypothetical protein
VYRFLLALNLRNLRNLWINAFQFTARHRLIIITAVTMTLYDPELTLREARSLYFEINNFKGGGYDDRWVKMKAGPIPIAFPNTAARVRAVKLHDLHHVLTNYPTTWTGESEIGAWEIASGCGNHYPAWLLNLLAFAIGLVISPGKTYRAFIRGRHSGNLYRTVFSEELLECRVGAKRRELHLENVEAAASLGDQLSFVVWAFISILTHLLTTLLTLSPLIILVLLFFR